MSKNPFEPLVFSLVLAIFTPHAIGLDAKIVHRTKRHVSGPRIGVKKNCAVQYKGGAGATRIPLQIGSRVGGAISRGRSAPQRMAPQKIEIATVIGLQDLLP